jgi:hypothetical protein
MLLRGVRGGALWTLVSFEGGESQNDVSVLAEKVAQAIEVPIEVDHESVRRLLEKADAAMYAAKRKALRYWIHEHVADETLRGTTALVNEPPPAA